MRRYGGDGPDEEERFSLAKWNLVSVGRVGCALLLTHILHLLHI